ncbi:MAG: hypothetical protein AAF171_26740 [Cyanobacteria bacterium P01_A01_bin.116]
MLFFQRLSLVASLVGTTLGASMVLPARSLAQSALPACPPPAAQEYLLLVRGNTEAERANIAATLPADNTVLVCQYLDEVLVRAGGFTSLETANAWATYLTLEEGYESFVSKPAGTAQPVVGQGAPPRATSATGGNSAYQPVQLGSGYAVLVDYGNRPEVGAAVSQVTRPVGLAVYRQKPYLLAQYTGDAASAATTLQRLYDAQLSAILVDSEEVVRLSSEIAQF